MSRLARGDRVGSRTDTVIALDLGGTKIAAAAVTRDGTLRDLTVRPTRAGARQDARAEAIVDTLAALVHRLQHRVERRGARVAGVAVATPGIVDRASGRVRFATPALPGWSGLPLRERLAAATGHAVLVANDGHAAAWGEWTAGAARGVADAVVLTLGTGVGGGIVSGGRLLDGALGAAGRLGHLSVAARGRACWCGGRGCLEQYASGTAVERSARRARLGLAPGRRPAAQRERAGWTAADVVRAARAGDPDARRILQQAGTALGAALASLVNVLNPDRIVIGGGLAAAGALLLEPAECVLRSRLPRLLAARTAVRRSPLGRRAALLGVADLWWRSRTP